MEKIHTQCINIMYYVIYINIKSIILLIIAMFLFIHNCDIHHCFFGICVDGFNIISNTQHEKFYRLIDLFPTWKSGTRSAPNRFRGWTARNEIAASRIYLFAALHYISRVWNTHIHISSTSIYHIIRPR